MSWKVYQQHDNYGCNMLENFKSFQQAQAGSPLYSSGMQIDPDGQFEHDANHDKLPAVSWIIPTSFQSEHPDYMPADGAAFVASKIDAIAANPDVWAKTVFILNYDENDGLFDHVPPPVPARGTPHEFVGGFPIGGGFRVPCIIVSPWTAGGWVCSERFDHTSVLQFLETFTGVREPNITDWRRRTFGNLTSAFRFRDVRKRTAGTAGHRWRAPHRRIRSDIPAPSRFPHNQPASTRARKAPGYRYKQAQAIAASNPLGRRVDDNQRLFLSARTAVAGAGCGRTNCRLENRFRISSRLWRSRAWRSSRST